MASKTLQEEFQMSTKKKTLKIASDYDIFKDKVLLDKLRKKIIENIIDNNLENSDNLEQYVNDVIDKSLEGYDLSTIERTHVFDLIEDELKGYGPLTVLLKDKNVTEIMVNAPDQIYVEMDGRIIKDESISFINNDHICICVCMFTEA